MYITLRFKMRKAHLTTSIITLSREVDEEKAISLSLVSLPKHVV
jgi:hypothetical protein